LGASIAAVSSDDQAESAELAQTLGVEYDLLSDTSRRTITAYGVADAKRELAMPAVFVVSSDRVVAWRAVGATMRDLPPLEAVLQAVQNAAGPSSTQ
jgi:peroxiredoxin